MHWLDVIQLDVIQILLEVIQTTTNFYTLGCHPIIFWMSSQIITWTSSKVVQALKSLDVIPLDVIRVDVP